VADDSTRVDDSSQRERSDQQRVRRKGISAPEPLDDYSSGHAAGATDAQEWLHEEAPPLPIGTVVRERFELVSVIGKGGMGVVYRALDRLHFEMHDRDPYVAVKILSEQFKRHPNALMTLQREVRKAQVLAHENIINVHTFDRDGSIAYMTMELLDGKSLRVIISENADGLPPAEVEKMIHGMGKALAYAHENGIVHSDFKPSNVFLTRKGQIKVLDFGVARALPVEAAGEPNESSPEEHEVGGFTPAYASVEMLRGEEPVPADDVFALAIVSHELLTGRHPFGHGPVEEEELRHLGAKNLKGLRWSQRKALARAISAERESRHNDAGDFLKQFVGSNTLRMRVLVGVLAASLVALIVSVTTSNSDVAPVTEFESLPADVQAQFNTAIDEGQTALSFGDAGINDAFYYFSRAYELHPNNQSAIVGLEAVADRFLGSIRTADIDTQRDVFDLLYCQDYLAGYGPVVVTCEDLLGRECEVVARSCVSGPGP
jgi:tRNA A-37 threonylcarbamoyl transferase component Bud32